MASIGIIATIGPVSANFTTLQALREAGMTVARLNGSHGNLDWHRQTIRLIREAVPGVPVLLDIPGRKIRTIQLAHEPSFKEGETLILTTDISHDGTEKVPVNFDGLHEQLAPGIRLYADDGTLSFQVERIDGRDIHVRAGGDGTLRSRKGINVPDVSLGRELVTSNDRTMVDFARDNRVDYLGISFVESAEHVDAIRGLIGGRAPRIVAKVENQGGLDNLEAIVGAADVIMIDRGDLSVETNVDSVSVFQKRIITTANSHGKPVIVATELLHSMIDNPYPTKAEIGDITNAVIDGASLLMLSGETAVGRYPVEAVGRLKNIAAISQTYLSTSAPQGGPKHEIARAVKALISTLPVDKIVVVSRSGYAVGLVASASVQQQVIAVHDDPWVARTLNLVPGVSGIHLSKVDWQVPSSALHDLKEVNDGTLLRPEDVVLIVGANQGDDRDYFNSFQTLRVGGANQPALQPN
ncbi:pyruvate kinase [Agrobacterium vitis]|uniref:pyruvate kinase n=1 Tax=Agrobacterium vitis TaxID=373 RepID=UPI0012E98C6E|nr:pyruvate kinase [Agrobacterium vitis]MVA54345.1 pyruvate kinase [Agrobacterium vitis]NSZ52110.1 pyruvate kinase [Agrobacterium vitis]NTA30869.1 pyruvate kinase [Agrobacterium vitis]